MATNAAKTRHQCCPHDYSPLASNETRFYRNDVHRSVDSFVTTVSSAAMNPGQPLMPRACKFLASVFGVRPSRELTVLDVVKEKGGILQIRGEESLYIPWPCACVVIHAPDKTPFEK